MDYTTAHRMNNRMDARTDRVEIIMDTILPEAVTVDKSNCGLNVCVVSISFCFVFSGVTLSVPCAVVTLVAAFD